MIIVGGGLAGLLAANLIHDSEVWEAQSKLPEHRAVLRFRSPAIGDAVGVPFREVTVRKAIWYDGQFVQPNIQVANLYSQKVTGSSVLDRSIWNIESEQRWIAPFDFNDILAAKLGARLNLGKPYSFDRHGGPYSSRTCISTAPMPVLATHLGQKHDIQFKSKPIWIDRYEIEDCSVFQTIYFPAPESMRAYRASITGNKMAIESADGPPTEEETEKIFDIFGLDFVKANTLDSGEQKYGKLVPIDEKWRRDFILKMTQNYKIYSLGRFATWRNILLDDVIKDIAVIKKLLGSDAYTHARMMAK